MRYRCLACLILPIALAVGGCQTANTGESATAKERALVRDGKWGLVAVGFYCQSTIFGPDSVQEGFSDYICAIRSRSGASKTLVASGTTKAQPANSIKIGPGRYYIVRIMALPQGYYKIGALGVWDNLQGLEERSAYVGNSQIGEAEFVVRGGTVTYLGDLDPDYAVGPLPERGEIGVPSITFKFTSTPEKARELLSDELNALGLGTADMIVAPVVVEPATVDVWIGVPDSYHFLPIVI